MKKSTIIVSVLGLLCAVCMFVSGQANRHPSPAEVDWNTGVYDYTHSTTSNNQAIATRGGRFTVDTNFVVITNAGVTTNSLIWAQFATTETSNAVRSIQASNGTFRIELFSVPTNNAAAIKYFIINY